MVRYVVTIFLGAFLLFQVQPMIGKFILPWFGGSPAVWTTCMLFFQVLLLAGYAYAHVNRRLSTRARARAHVGLLVASLATLPVIPSAALWKPTGSEYPTWHILLLLAAVVGAPYFLLSTTSPLLQDWFARTHVGRSPYRLYALSNLGSLLALVSYPFLVEPHLPLRMQAYAWSAVYAAFVASCTWCAYRVVRRESGGVATFLPENRKGVRPQASPVSAGEPPRAGVVALWLLLAACGSLVLLSTTNQLCQEVAVVPFLWIVPLALYLLTFVIAFDNPRWYVRNLFTLMILFLLVWTAAVTMFLGVRVHLPAQIAVYSATLFACCMLCHGELARLKPSPRHLTLFYLMVAAGGALGGLFVVLVATHLFRGYWEYHLALTATCLLAVITYIRLPVVIPRRAKPAWAWALLVVAALGVLVMMSCLIQHVLCCAVFAGVWLVAIALHLLDEKWISKARATWRAAAVLLLGFAVITVSMKWFAQDTSSAFSSMDQLLRYRPYYMLLASVCAATLVLHFLDRRSKLSPGKPFWAWAVLLIGFAGITGTLIREVSNSSGDALARSRNFYGVLKVTDWSDGGPNGERRSMLVLTNGRIEHGCQYLDNDLRRMPTSYYGTDSGGGVAINSHPRRTSPAEGDNASLRIGVIGLGAGTLAVYGKPGDLIRFYEINPEVVRLAKRYFTYCKDTPARVDVVLGDGRITLERELAQGHPQQFDVLAVDAFTSDAIPMHLLTRECADVYLEHLRPDGILAFHISNRCLDLAPVVRRLAAAFGREAVHVKSLQDPHKGIRAADWVLVTNNRKFLDGPELKRVRTEWKIPAKPAPLWTDDYGSLFQVLKK